MLINRTTTVTVGGGTVTVTQHAPYKRSEPKQRRGDTPIPPCIHSLNPTNDQGSEGILLISLHKLVIALSLITPLVRSLQLLPSIRR